MISPLPTLRFIAQHPLSSRNKLGAYWRYIRWQIESRLKSEMEYQWLDGAKLVVKRGMTGATGNIYCGLHEFVDMAFLLHLLRPQDLFVDVGANIGSYSVLASGACKARSIAIEPDPVTVEALRRNVFANAMENRVQIVPAFVGAMPGEVLFSVGCDTTNRVIQEPSSGARRAAVRTLDDILGNEPPVLMKMDVEGYEHQVLLGGTRTIAQPSLMAVITENAQPEVKVLLEKNGFQIASYEPFERKLAPGTGKSAGHSANSLFIRNMSACRTRLETAPSRLIAGQQL